MHLLGLIEPCGLINQCSYDLPPLPSSHLPPPTQVPFFTGLSGGLYESLYVVIPGTVSIVEILGDFTTPTPIPENHIRLSSTQQFCTPKRRLGEESALKRRRLRQAEGQTEGAWGHTEGLSFPLDPAALGVAYSAGDADINKTTIAGCDPTALVTFAQRYLGGSPIQQHRGVPADGQCAKLAWAQFYAGLRGTHGHQWHVVNTAQADWITKDSLRPAVPFNTSDLAAYQRQLRRLGGGGGTGSSSYIYDQWLDYREIFVVDDLDPFAKMFRADGVPFGVWARRSGSSSSSSRSDTPEAAAGSCSIFVAEPINGVVVELMQQTGPFGAITSPLCQQHMRDLCATK
jgi:hypothetical protein